ncbi:MAG: hypothetical protein ACTXOO_05730 [Sodalis sp. (in: enterobacteria)]
MITINALTWVQDKMQHRNKFFSRKLVIATLFTLIASTRPRFLLEGKMPA